jgi:hypothetical protein
VNGAAIVTIQLRFPGTTMRVPGLALDTSKAALKRRSSMRTIFKYASTVALTGALALAAASPSEARNGRNAAAIGFGVGAIAGAAIASSAYNGGYYGYYGHPGYGYAYAPGYAYDSYPDDSYAYEPAYIYAAPSYRYGYYYGDNWERQHRTNNFSIDSQR